MILKQRGTGGTIDGPGRLVFLQFDGPHVNVKAKPPESPEDVVEEYAFVFRLRRQTLDSTLDSILMHWAVSTRARMLWQAAPFGAFVIGDGLIWETSPATEVVFKAEILEHEP